MRDPDLTTLRLFVNVCETRNIERAGEHAHIVGSAISKRLVQLEELVGARLLVRNRRGVEPTAAGETMLQHARAVLAAIARMERDMLAYASGSRGVVRVLATTSMLSESLAADVAAFLADPAHAGIQVNLEESVSRDIVRGLREGAASLGFCWDITELGGLQSRPYRTDHLAALVHPQHELARRRRVRFEEVAAHPLVSMPSGSAIQTVLQTKAADMACVLRQPVTVDSVDAALRVVHARLACAIVPLEALQPTAAALGLRAIPLADAWARRRFVVCFKDESALGMAARLLLDHLSPPESPEGERTATRRTSSS